MIKTSNSIITFNNLCFYSSKIVTKSYSTSFYSATNLLHHEVREAIHSIYGFVRFADEIVDTFHNFDKVHLLTTFEKDYYDGFRAGISLNPILNSFQLTVKKYDIPDVYIQEFLNSMKADLDKKQYVSKSEMEEYVYGSADVVGLMCLKVFCNNDQNLFQSLVVPAMRLGSAFQKVNFLRDIKEDTETLGRVYFPQLTTKVLDENVKNELVNDIQQDFEIAYEGIKKLPENSKAAVFVAYKYYKALLTKIKKTPALELTKKRIRINDGAKMLIYISALLKYKLKLNFE